MNEEEPYRQLAGALGRVPSGLFIVTASQGESETGMLASWVQQCAFKPPHITMAIQKDRPILPWLSKDSFFTVNVLDDSQTDMIGHFGRGYDLGEPAFKGLEIERLGQGGPVLREALAYLLCRVKDRYAVDDHNLYVGEVIGGRVLNDGHPMIHVRKSGFHY